MNPPLQGEVRRFPPSVGIRILQAVSLWFVARGLASLVLRHALRFRHTFRLTASPEQLVLTRTKVLLGRQISTTETVLPVAHLCELSLARQGESPIFAVGLGALSLGTFVGVHAIAEGALAGAWSLLGPGLLLVALGLTLDFLVGSGRSRTSFRSPPELLIQTEGSRGFALVCPEADQAEALVSLVKEWLQSPPQGQAPSP